MKTIIFSTRKCVQFIVVFIAALFCFANTSKAITYYISTTGNDVTGNGTIANPWKTLYKATSTVTVTGNTIHVLPGIYIESQQMNLAVGVSIVGANKTTTIIKGALTDSYSPLIDLQSADGTNGNQSISNITFDGQYVNATTHKTWLAIWITGRSNVSIHDCIIKDFYWRGIIYNGINADNPGTDIGYTHATGNTFYNNTVTNSADYGISGGGSGALNIGFQDGMLIYNNNIQQTERPEGLNGWPIKYWNDGWLKGCKIYNNILTKIPYGGTYPGESGWDFCIEFFNIQGLEIYGNTIQGSIDLNYNYKGNYAYSVWIHDNLLQHSVLNTHYESSIILEYRTESALIENNIVKNRSNFIQYCTRGVNDYGGDNLPNPGGTPVGGYSYIVDNIIRKNVCSNIYQGNGIGTSGGILVISEGTDDPQIKNMQIYNNTTVAKAGDAPYFGLDFTSQPYGNGDSLFIRNNIITGFSGAWLQGSNTSTNLNHTTVTNNNAWGNGSSNVPVWPAGNPGNYINSNNTNLNPQFVSATDFHLQATSPCVNTGVYVGIPYSGTAPEKGYIEISAPLPVTLAEFTVAENNGKNLLLWKTETEVNSNYFIIERSSNGTDYKAIGTVAASGFSTTVVNYNFIDANPLAGTNYYRLTIVDKDNSMEYSNVISISGKKNHSTTIVTTYLSAAKNTLELNVYATQNKKANLMLFDNNGRNIFTEPVLLQNGINTINKKTPALSKGIYYIRLFTENEVLVKNILGGD